MPTFLFRPASMLITVAPSIWTTALEQSRHPTSHRDGPRTRRFVQFASKPDIPPRVRIKSSPPSGMNHAAAVRTTCRSGNQNHLARIVTSVIRYMVARSMLFRRKISSHNDHPSTQMKINSGRASSASS